MTGDPWRWVAQVAESFGGPGWVDTAILGAQSLLAFVVVCAILMVIALLVRSVR